MPGAGSHLHSRMPPKYSPTSGTSIIIMLIGSPPGESTIESPAITSTAIRHFDQYMSTLKMWIRSRNSITSGN